MLDAKVWYFSLGGGGASPSDDVWGVQGVGSQPMYKQYIRVPLPSWGFTIVLL